MQIFFRTGTSVPAALLDPGSSPSQNLGDEDNQCSIPEEEVNGNVILSFHIFIFSLHFNMQIEVK